MKTIAVDEYFRKAESMRPMELVYGVVREPPAPPYGRRSLEIIALESGAHVHRTFDGDTIPASLVLPAWSIPVRELFE